MTPGEAIKFWYPACERFKESDSFNDLYGASKAVAAVLGLPYPCPYHWRDIIVTPSLRRKLELLAGPHWKTVIKILQARQ